MLFTGRFFLNSTAKPNRLNITEGEQSPEQLLDFTFKVNVLNRGVAALRILLFWRMIYYGHF